MSCYDFLGLEVIQEGLCNTKTEKNNNWEWEKKGLQEQFFLIHSQQLWANSAICFNPFTPESDQCQNSPAASQEIWHRTVWRTWLFIAYSDEKWLYYKFSLHHSYNRFLKGWENTLFELRSERVNLDQSPSPWSTFQQTGHNFGEWAKLGRSAV